MSSAPVTSVTPIDEIMQYKVAAEVKRYLQLAQSLYDQTFDPIEVLFDIKGKAAGMYRVKRQLPAKRASKNILQRLTTSHTVSTERVIRFNPWLFAKYPQDSWSNTIPHEVAHYLVDCLYGYHRVKAHGNEWQQVMRDLGAEPIVRANYDLSGIPQRRVKRYTYACDCRHVELSAYRHNKIRQGLQRYRCRDCGVDLQYQMK